MGSRAAIGAYFQAQEEQGDRRHEKSHVRGNGMRATWGGSRGKRNGRLQKIDVNGDGPARGGKEGQARISTQRL
ncbi:hypothetical protein B296_00043850 [Ensete ventricosum]|uniref:Uncharacterized protein n=1 Tax=Ensete ventricosum TaxID=4639 RepID=A0A426YB97_ENSVE|nr:hypothetical protein B296_00043850 [Ensete ventricosum]